MKNIKKLILTAALAFAPALVVAQNTNYYPNYPSMGGSGGSVNGQPITPATVAPQNLTVGYIPYTSTSQIMRDTSATYGLVAGVSASTAGGIFQPGAFRTTGPVTLTSTGLPWATNTARFQLEAADNSTCNGTFQLDSTSAGQSLRLGMISNSPVICRGSSAYITLGSSNLVTFAGGITAPGLATVTNVSATNSISAIGTIQEGACTTSLICATADAGKTCYKASNNTKYYCDGANSWTPVTVSTKVSASTF